MFVVSIFGGLASQMNQYAFMLTLKKLYPGVQVKMAVGGDWLKKLEHNGYELDSAFGIPPERASKAEINQFGEFLSGIRPGRSLAHDDEVLSSTIWPQEKPTGDLGGSDGAVSRSASAESR